MSEKMYILYISTSVKHEFVYVFLSLFTKLSNHFEKKNR